jgi:hypothetical protein
MVRCVVTESLFENMRHRSVCRIVCLRVVLSGGVCQDGCTPLLAAVRGSFDTIVSLLLGAGADGNVALLV